MHTLNSKVVTLLMEAGARKKVRCGDRDLEEIADDESLDGRFLSKLLKKYKQSSRRNMFSIFSQLCGRLAQRPRRRNLRVVALALVFVVFGGALGGCVIVSLPALTTPGNPIPVARHFPSALLAEPIELRAGFSHVTQPFLIKGPQERWSVALGFVRSDQAMPLHQKLNGSSDVCWTDSSTERSNLSENKCKTRNPGFNLRWELLREEGTTVAQYEHDNLVQRGGGTYAWGAITRTLSGFSNQTAGSYRLRVTVLRDANELDFLKPHILVDRPFFSSRSID